MNGRWWPRKRTPPAEHSISPPSQPRSATVMAAILGDNRIYWPGVWSRPEFVSSRPSTVPESLGTPTRTISISSATALSRRCSRRSSRFWTIWRIVGLLDSTLVIWMGDFGRSPKINRDAGRDHWPQCYSMVLAGGGIRGGQVIGQSDKIGAFPVSRPITPADVHATVYAALGYDPHGTTYRTLDGRPLVLADGQPISELL